MRKLRKLVIAAFRDVFREVFQEKDPAKQLQAAKKMDWEGLKNFNEKQKNTIKTLKALLRIPKVGISEYEKALMRLTIYLFIAEGSYANCMNLVCYLLTLQGHDLYNYLSRSFACSVDEIAKVEPLTKELFLSKHGFELLNQGWDRNLRNNIAHYNFEIEDDGTTKIDGTVTDVEKKIDQIIDFVLRVNIYLTAGFEESRRKQKQARQDGE